MAATEYPYTISTETLNGAADLNSLAAEYQASAIVTALDYINIAGDTLAVWTKDALSTGDKTLLDAVLAAHEGISSGTRAETVAIQEELIATGGHYQAQSFEITVPASAGWETLDISFPIPIGILDASVNLREVEEGDEIDMTVAPDTVTGTITANVAAAATVIDVAQTVIDNAAVGYYIKLDDGTNADDMGRILSIDKVGLKLTMETATTNAFLAATPSYVKQSVKMVPHIWLSKFGTVTLGSAKIGASYVPANTTIRIRYNNVSVTAKTFSFILEYLY